MSKTYTRGVVVKGSDLLAEHDYRPYVCLSDESHPFSDEEALYAAITTTRRAVAIPLGDNDFVAGGLPRESYVNPWTLVSIRHSDIQQEEGRLVEETITKISNDAANYLGA
jgi:mRNA-degrading endonuclease toxin of MazEF toxin-antitoxin module